MRRIFLSLSLLSASLFSQTITVVDPLDAPVPGARVLVYRGPDVIQSVETGSTGQASLSGGGQRIEVLAPGFDRAIVTTSDTGALKVKLQIAAASESVSVTASQTPLAEAQANTAVDIVSGFELRNRQPTDALDALRFLPGVIGASSGRRGNLGSLFVRGGDSRYNKVLIDGVPVTEPGGSFDFGVVPAVELERIELLRGPAGVIYGSDAMTSVVQLFTARGSTSTPELRFGAEGGTFETARGYASLAGAISRFDYNLFGEQLHTEGQGVNDAFANASQGTNLGLAVTPKVAARLRLRHSNARTGIQNAWVFNQRALLAPDMEQFARQNNFLASLDLAYSASDRWKHTLRGAEYNHKRRNADLVPDRGCDVVNFDFTDCFFDTRAKFNRATFNYQAEFMPVAWTRGIYGYEYENENGVFTTAFDTLDFTTFLPTTGNTQTRGLRQNQAVFAQQIFDWKRVNALAGVRFVHNDSFGNRGVPQANVSVLLLRGGELFSGTRLRFAYGEGIKEPRFEETFGVTGTFITLPNPELKAERNRAYETGLIQNLGANASLAATYFHNRFGDQIVFDCDPVTFQCRYRNLSDSLAHGAEAILRARASVRVTFDVGYVYTATQILDAPATASPLFAVGAPLLRRPKHAASASVNVIGSKWGANVSGVYVGRRADSDFFLLPAPIISADAYSRVDLSGWYAINRFLTGYAAIENAFNKKYEEVLGYPALKANFRAGLRFRVGGD